jgi:anaerobic selenocysteine-containing dehydrogenase
MIQENVRRVWGKNSGNIQDSCQATAPLLYRAIITEQPYPIKALITMASNPMVTQGNTKLVYEALKKLDLYVVVDFWMTPSAQLADYVLPAACWLERPVLWTGFGTHHSVLGGERSLPSAIAGEYDHRTDFQFWRGLGLRLGQEEYWPWQTMEEVFDYRLEPMGVTFQGFMEKGGRDFPPVDYNVHEKRGFGTPTGKIELYSTILEKLGYDPLPFYQEPSETPVSRPDLAKEYPLVLITGGRHRPFFHSEFRQIDSLRRRHPDPLVQIHPETAEQLGIADSDWVWIETPRGRVRQKCQYFSGINPGVVHAQHGWWFPELPGEEPWLHGVWESNINVCTADDPERLNTKLGAWPLRTFLCKIYKTKTYK